VKTFELEILIPSPKMRDFRSEETTKLSFFNQYNSDKHILVSNRHPASKSVDLFELCTHFEETQKEGKKKTVKAANQPNLRRHNLDASANNFDLLRHFNPVINCAKFGCDRSRNVKSVDPWKSAHPFEGFNRHSEHRRALARYAVITC
jgi:hypothetical protein